MTPMITGRDSSLLPNNSLMLTRLAGEEAVALGLPTSHRMKASCPSRRAA